MRSNTTSAVFALLSGVSAVSASYPLATVTPCPSCPKGVCPELITVTSQYQAVSTCTPVTTYGAKSVGKVVPSCSSYDYVSTVIPCIGGKENTTVTYTDQMVTISHLSTVLTSYSTVAVPCPTQAPSYNGTYPKYPAGKCESSSTSTKYQTLVVDTSCAYNQIGPFAIAGYEGSGLCKDCAAGVNGTESQKVHVSKCLDGVCQTYPETWVSKSVAPTSTAAAAISASSYCSENGVYTIPIVQTIQPSNSAYAPVTTTAMYTTTVTNAPVQVTCTKTVTVHFTSTRCPYETIVSGSTVQPTSYPTYPASVSAGQTYPSYPVSTSAGSGESYSTYAPSTVATYSASATNGPSTTPTPSPPAESGDYDYVGCSGSNSGFPSFNLIESSGLMTVDLCTTECHASGYSFAGLHSTDCYCANSLDAGTSTDVANGVCDLPCPGNHLQTCGGNAAAYGPNGILLDLYECATPTSTSTTTTTSPTTSATPDPSSDPEPYPETRNIHADMETAPVKARDDTKMRRGGMLRNANKAIKGSALAKRDYGLKKNALI